MDVLLLDVADALPEGLERRLHGAAPEVVDRDDLGHLVLDLVVVLDLEGVGDFDLGYRVLQVPVFDDLADVDDLDIAGVGVEDDLEGVVGAVALLDHGAKHVLDDHAQRVTVDVFLAGDLGEGGDERAALHGGGESGRVAGLQSVGKVGNLGAGRDPPGAR